MDAHLRLARLMAGRTDAFGAVHGESIKQPLTDHEWFGHTFANGSVGVYPLLDNGCCKWGCVDIDEGYDLIAIAANVWRALKALGITSFVERSKGKGFHCWTFCSDWVAASDMIGAQRVACQLADYRPKEVNPKQAGLSYGQVGSYVNAAYAHDWVVQGKRVVLDMTTASRPILSLAQFLEFAEDGLNPPDVIARAAALYVPPPAPRPVHFDGATGDVGVIASRLTRVTKLLFEDGPLPAPDGRIDRSAALQRLAHLMATDQFTPAETLALVREFDSRLEKYVGRSDAEIQYQKIVERAHG